MSYALAHFSVGAMLSLLIFRAVDYHSIRIRTVDYLRYDIVVMTLGGVWAMIPDLPYVFGVMKPLFGSGVSNIFAFHGFLDEFDPNDSIVVSFVLFGLFLLVMNVVTLSTIKEMED